MVHGPLFTAFDHCTAFWHQVTVAENSKDHCKRDRHATTFIYERGRYLDMTFIVIASD